MKRFTIITAILCVALIAYVVYMAIPVMTTSGIEVKSRTSLINKIPVSDSTGKMLHLYIFQTDFSCWKPFDASLFCRSEVRDNGVLMEGEMTPETKISSNNQRICQQRVFIYLTSDGRYAFSDQILPENISYDEIETLCDKRMLTLEDDTEIQWQLSGPPFAPVTRLHQLDASISTNVIEGKSENAPLLLEVLIFVSAESSRP